MSGNLTIFDIKSRYIIKDIFSNLDERKQLELILYNKKLENILNVDIETFKKISGILKIAPKNGAGKEYILGTNKLIFEGEYINKKRSGYGKEYDKFGYIKYEGKFLNGKRNGAGKEYYNDDVIFEGEFLEGKKNGKGVEYYDNYQIKYEGEYKNGKKWDGIGYSDSGKEMYILKNGSGYVKEYNDFGTLIFEGEYLNSKENGKGKEYNSKHGKLEFDGEYKNGKKWKKMVWKNNKIR